MLSGSSMKIQTHTQAISSSDFFSVSISSTMAVGGSSLLITSMCAAWSGIPSMQRHNRYRSLLAAVAPNYRVHGRRCSRVGPAASIPRANAALRIAGCSKRRRKVASFIFVANIRCSGMRSCRRAWSEASCSASRMATMRPAQAVTHAGPTIWFTEHEFHWLLRRVLRPPLASARRSVFPPHGSNS